MRNKNIIARGAEAVLSQENGKIIKERIKKSYRLPELDNFLRKRRTRLEARLMAEARRTGVDVPAVVATAENKLEIEFIDGVIVKDFVNVSNCAEIGSIIGENIAKLHSAGIIHGDLTTSNMIQKNAVIFLIDFGLGFQSRRIEDMAVDLHLLKEVITATHNEIEEKFWNAIISAYQNTFHGADKVIKTLFQIEKRGRYRKRSD